VVAAAIAAPRVREALAALGIRGPADLVACYLAGPPELTRFLEGVPAHVDDLPAVEYESGQLFEPDRTWLATFTALLLVRPPEPPAALLAGLPPEEVERARTVWRERGALLRRQRDALARRLGVLGR
jgi:hypothetical protein